MITTICFRNDPQKYDVVHPQHNNSEATQKQAIPLKRQYHLWQLPELACQWLPYANHGSIMHWPRVRFYTIRMEHDIRFSNMFMSEHET